MKIGPEHIGRTVIFRGYLQSATAIVIGVDGNTVWLRDTETGNRYEQPTIRNEAKLVEEPKKPSERIQQITEAYICDNAKPGAIFKTDCVTEAIIKFLDEQAAKK